MDNLTLEWTKKSFNGNDVFYIVCQEYGTVGVVEGHVGGVDNFHVSWLYIEPFFRVKKGIKILMQLIRKEIPINDISKITYDCPKRKKTIIHPNRYIGSSFEEFMKTDG